MEGITAVFACLGAIVGAGFASGREVMAFFTCYGKHSWWLIAAASAVMGWICRLCMCASGAERDWTQLLGKRSGWMVGLSCCLMLLTGGAMVSAAGHLCALMFAGRLAGTAGAVCTLGAAWVMGRKNLKALGWLSAVLSIMLICVLAGAFRLPKRTVVLPQHAFSTGSLVRAGLGAAAYAAMNAMLASGVICKSSGRYTAAGVGGMLALLLGLSNGLYLRHPELLNEALPLVALLQKAGRSGFLLSAGLMYLSVFTTLTAVVCALRTAAQSAAPSPRLGAALVMGLLLAVSCIGFSEIVDALYAPAGLICLAAVFLPLQCRRARQSNA